MSKSILAGQTILFQGDSITDCGRSREDDTLLGAGYANLVAAWMRAARPRDELRFINRGISGNKVSDLKARWSEDCVDLRPDWVSIMIGINDTGHRYSRGTIISPREFADDYRAILGRVREETDAGIILLEPFLLPFPEDRRAWREDLDPRIAAVRDVAAEFKAPLLPLDGLLNSVAALREDGYLSADGVHPNQVGHALIAQHWLRAMGEL